MRSATTPPTSEKIAKGTIKDRVTQVSARGDCVISYINQPWAIALICPPNALHALDIQSSRKSLTFSDSNKLFSCTGISFFPLIRDNIKISASNSIDCLQTIRTEKQNQGDFALILLCLQGGVLKTAKSDVSDFPRFSIALDDQQPRQCSLALRVNSSLTRCTPVKTCAKIH